MAADSKVLFARIDRLTSWCAAAGAWLFVAAGAMLVYEVVARYLFVEPTIWAAELAQLCLIWGTYLAVAALLRRREHIRITVLTRQLPAKARRWAEILSLIVVLALCLVAIWYGVDIAVDSFDRDRTSGSMLNLPAWVSEASVPAGFVLVGLQAVVELLRLVSGGPVPDPETAQP
ncbi:MAG: TRAP transporter small permease [Pseudomonadota bacterium]